MLTFACIVWCFDRSPFALSYCSDRLVCYLCACNCSAMAQVEHFFLCLNAGEQWCSVSSCFQVLAICTITMVFFPGLVFLPASNQFNNNKDDSQRTESWEGEKFSKIQTSWCGEDANVANVDGRTEPWIQYICAVLEIINVKPLCSKTGHLHFEGRWNSEGFKIWLWGISTVLAQSCGDFFTLALLVLKIQTRPMGEVRILGSDCLVVKRHPIVLPMFPTRLPAGWQRDQ